MLETRRMAASRSRRGRRSGLSTGPREGAKRGPVDAPRARDANARSRDAPDSGASVGVMPGQGSAGTGTGAGPDAVRAARASRFTRNQRA